MEWDRSRGRKSETFCRLQYNAIDDILKFYQSDLKIDGKNRDEELY